MTGILLTMINFKKVNFISVFVRLKFVQLNKKKINDRYIYTVFIVVTRLPDTTFLQGEFPVFLGFLYLGN